ncbi:CrcB protein [Nocardioides salarius]|uniref:Fluoride-specific ion channel FluC n=1 Tax=Nocardioides salarius TaxID=374513 RepID=A0ABS2MBZ0_9ACTN|nr:CrcB family protein [Nocardioides salarius]MBM7508720.1 CrcB protein [Nocardioides salarius]
MTPLLVALGGAGGAALRWRLGARLDSAAFPRGTLLANLAGSLLLGLLVGLALRGHALALLGTGFCGALTTYSSFAVQAHDLGRRAAAYALVTLVGSLLLCALGFMVGSRL